MGESADCGARRRHAWESPRGRPWERAGWLWLWGASPCLHGACPAWRCGRLSLFGAPLSALPQPRLGLWRHTSLGLVSRAWAMVS
jgi:hypothetical protein